MKISFELSLVGKPSDSLFPCAMAEPNFGVISDWLQNQGCFQGAYYYVWKHHKLC